MQVLHVLENLIEFLEGTEKEKSPNESDIQILSYFLKNLDANFARLATQTEIYSKAHKNFRSLVVNLINSLKSTYLAPGTASMGGSSPEEQDEALSLLLVLDTYETLQRRLSTLHLRAQDCEPVLVTISALRSKCQKIAEPGSCFRAFYNFCFTTGVGSLDQLKIEIENNYCAKNIKVPVDGAVLDSMVILPLVEGETARQKDLRLRGLEHQLEDKEANASRDNSLKYCQTGLRFNDSTFTNESIAVSVLCLANAMPFEVTFYEQWLLRFFLERGIHVVLWNYRGYGRSSGSTSLEVS